MNDGGGPAFPCKTDDKHRAFLHSERDGESNMPYKIVEHPGMTLRDYFAAAALKGLLSNRDWAGYTTVVEYAYEIADHMILQRSTKKV